VDVAVVTPPFPLLEDPALRPRFETLFLYVRRSLLVPLGLLVVEHPEGLDPRALGLGAPRDTRRTAASALSFWDGPAPA
jgi:hypothetical protein